MILLHVYSSCQIVFSCDDNSRYQTYRHYCDWHRQKIKLTGSQPLAHPTAEPVEILITRLPQKIESVGPTHHKHLKHHYFPEIFRAQAPRFYFGALHGVLISSSRLPKKDVIVIVTCPTSCSAGVMTVVEWRWIKWLRCSYVFLTRMFRMLQVPLWSACSTFSNIFQATCLSQELLNLLGLCFSPEEDSTKEQQRLHHDSQIEAERGESLFQIASDRLSRLVPPNRPTRNMTKRSCCAAGRNMLGIDQCQEAQHQYQELLLEFQNDARLKRGTEILVS